MGERLDAYKALGKEPDNKTQTVKDARAWMCKMFFDVRAFGAVMSTGKAGHMHLSSRIASRPDMPGKYTLVSRRSGGAVLTMSAAA